MHNIQYNLGPPELRTKFEFQIFKKVNKLTIINNKLQRIDKIGIFLSGGLDSAALLCLILTELKNINKLEIPVVCFTVAKENIPTHFATNVVHYAQDKFDVVINHINNIPNDSEANSLGILGKTPVNFVNNYSSTMIVYLGQNNMAPDEVRPFTQRLAVDYGINKTHGKFTSPFLFLHKPHIIDLIYQLNCEGIIPLTKSCSANAISNCGVCYACAERKWGFDALGKTDIGNQT